MGSLCASRCYVLQKQMLFVPCNDALCDLIAACGTVRVTYSGTAQRVILLSVVWSCKGSYQRGAVGAASLYHITGCTNYTPDLAGAQVMRAADFLIYSPDLERKGIRRQANVMQAWR